MKQDVHISLRDVNFTYPGGQKALDCITLEAARGKRLGIIGPNGAGKSTLLHTILGLLTCDSGRIVCNDRLLAKKSTLYFRNEIGLLFQNPDDQLFCPTLEDDIAFGPSRQGLTQEALKARVASVLEQTGIAHLAKRPPYTLSGGEKKTAALASILSMHPSALLMDETSAHLDPRSRRRLLDIIGTLSQTMLIVSHDLDFIWECCDETAILNSGKLIARGKTTEILRDRGLLEANGMELPLRLQGCPVCSGK